ncbi:unnamed protein product, partial [Ectocarpus sp. 12 AP-2014]
WWEKVCDTIRTNAFRLREVVVEGLERGNESYQVGNDKWDNSRKAVEDLTQLGKPSKTWSECHRMIRPNDCFTQLQWITTAPGPPSTDNCEFAHETPCRDA